LERGLLTPFLNNINFMKEFIKQKIRTLIKEEVNSILEKRKLELAWDVISTKSGDKYFTTKILGDLRIRVAVDSKLSRYIFCETFEKAELNFLNRVLKPGDTFFDVGSNVGLFTLAAARVVGPTGKVVAFEPATEAFNSVTHNVHLNRFDSIVTIHNIGISDTPGKLQLHESKDGFDAWNSFSTPSMGDAYDKIEVNVHPLDDFLSLTPDLVKIDVEGWERYALQGAKALLSQADAPVLLVEFTEVNLKSAGTSSKEIHAILKEYGYSVFELREDGTTVPHAILDEYEYSNLVFAKGKNPAS